MKLIIIILGISLVACKNNLESTQVQEPNKTIQESDKTIIQAEARIPTKHIDKDLKDELSTDCVCFNGIGSAKGEKPIIISEFSNGTSLILCGYFDEEMQDKGLTMSEFNIFNCKTGESLVEYGAIQTCIIEQKKDSLIIKELKYLPIGRDWSWEFIQIAKQEITFRGDIVNVASPTPVLENFEIDELVQEAFLKSLKDSEGFGPEWEADIGKLEVLSLLGNDRAWDILKNYEEFTGDKTDGALSEQLNDAVLTVEWIKEK